MIEYANENDIAGILELDGHIDQKILIRKISNNEVYVIREETDVIGMLRYSLFWDNTPFMNMICIKQSFQRKGLGSLMVKHWENDMKKQGHHRVMTSTLSNEEAQHFYRKLGYKDIGGFVLPNEPLEMLFVKDISA